MRSYDAWQEGGVELMAEVLSTSQLNKIGERLRKKLETEDDLRKLDEFRVSFESAYQHIFDELTKMGLKPGGRPQKTTPSIVAKLERERTRLSRMQDIAGCRAVVPTRVDQDRVVDELLARFPAAEVYDRREKPSHGYRAVHLVIDVDRRPIEIQVRTAVQDNWAAVSESLSVVLDPRIKYGGGPPEIQRFLTEISDFVARIENQEGMCAKARVILDKGLTLEEIEPMIIEQYEQGAHIVDQLRSQGGLKPYFDKMEADLVSMREAVNELLNLLLAQYNINSQDESR